MNGISPQRHGPALIEAAVANMGNGEAANGALVLARALAERLARVRPSADKAADLRVARALALNVIDLLEEHVAT